MKSKLNRYTQKMLPYILFCCFITNGQLKSQTDIYVYYTADAKSWIEGTGYGNTAGVDDFITNVIFKNANEYLNNSNVNIILSNAGSSKSTFKENAMTSDITIFRKNPLVHRTRLETKADVIVLLGKWDIEPIENTNYERGGLYEGSNSIKSNFETVGLCPNSKNVCFLVNVGIYSAATSKLVANTFLHELGHVFGLHHAKEDIRSGDYPEAGINEFAHGFKAKGTSNEIIGNDIMGYPTQAMPTDAASLIGYIKTQLPFFSSLNITYEKIFKITDNIDFNPERYIKMPVLGIANDQDNFNADAVSVLNNNAIKYAAFYPDVLTKSCNGLLKSVVQVDDFDLICGESTTGTCIGNVSNSGMKNAITRNFGFSYSALSNYKYLNSHIPLEGAKPLGIFCQKGQTCVFQIANPVTTESSMNINVNYLISNSGNSLIGSTVALSSRTSKSLFTVKLYVDNSLIADPIQILPQDITTLVDNKEISVATKIEIPVLLKPTDNKVQVLVTADNFDADNINTVLSITNIEFGNYTVSNTDVSTTTTNPTSTTPSTTDFSDISPVINLNTARVYFDDDVLFRGDCNRFQSYQTVNDGSNIPFDVFKGYTGLVKIHWGDGTTSREIGIGSVSWTSLASLDPDYLSIAHTYQQTKDIKNQGYFEHNYSTPGNYTITVEGQERTWDWRCTYDWKNWLMLNPIPSCGYFIFYNWLNIGQRLVTIPTLPTEVKNGKSILITTSSQKYFPLTISNNIGKNLKIDWGDGSSECFILSGSLFQMANHKYVRTGKFVVKVSIEVYNQTWACYDSYASTNYSYVCPNAPIGPRYSWKQISENNIFIPDIQAVINLLLN